MRRTAVLLRAAIAAALIAGLAPVLSATPADAATTVVVSPSASAGWFPVNGGGSSGALVSGPGTPPAGAGSYHQTVGANGNDVQRMRTSNFNGTALSAITTLGYHTSVTSHLDSQATYMRLYLDLNGNGTFDGTPVDDILFFEPAYQSGTYTMATGETGPVPNQNGCATAPCIPLNSWQGWDAKVGGWWSANDGTGGPPLRTLAGYSTLHPTATLATNVPALEMSAGGGSPSWDNFDGNFDRVVFNDTIYDFDVNAAVTPTTTTFDAFSLGSPHGQDGWSSTGSAGAAGSCPHAPYDHAVVTNTYGYPSFGSQSLRISNAVTSGCYRDQTFSKPTPDQAGEPGADGGGYSSGPMRSNFSAQFDFASTQTSEQPGLKMSVSPDRGDGSRMSYVRIEDSPGGLQVLFDDYNASLPGGCEDKFVESIVASGLPRTSVHTVVFDMQFNAGPSNDVVKVTVDGATTFTGTSWEDYFRCRGAANPPTVDSLLFKGSDPAAPATSGNGLLIDNVGSQAIPMSDTVDCATSSDDIAAVQAAVDAAPSGVNYTIKLSGTCDFTKAAAHGGDIVSDAATAVLIRPNPPIDGLTIMSAGAPQSATIQLLGTQTAFFVAPGNTNVTIKGLTFQDSGRPLMAVDTTNTTFGSDASGTTPDPQANRIFGNSGMDSAILAVSRANGFGDPAGTLSMKYGANGNLSTTFSTTGHDLRGFKAAGNYITFNSPGVSDGSTRNVVGVDVRNDGPVTDGVTIDHNAVALLASAFPTINDNGIAVFDHTGSPGGLHRINNVTIDANNLGRVEDFDTSMTTPDAAGRAAMLLTGLDTFSVTNNRTKSILTSTAVPNPGGGILMGDSVNGRVSGNDVQVIADPSTAGYDLGAIGVVDNLKALFNLPHAPTTGGIAVMNNTLGQPASQQVQRAGRGLVFNGADHSTATGNTVLSTSSAALSIGVAAMGPGDPSSPGATVQDPVRELVACNNSLDGAVDDPTEVENGNAPGSTRNVFPGGQACATTIALDRPKLKIGDDLTVSGVSWDRPMTVSATDPTSTTITHIPARTATDAYSTTFTAAELAGLQDGTITLTATVTDDLPTGVSNAASTSLPKDTVAPPAPVISAPANGSVLTTHAVTISGTADANATVHLFDGAASLGTTPADGVGGFSTNLTFADGPHTLKASATDAVGNTGPDSTLVTFTVDTTPPGPGSVHVLDGDGRVNASEAACDPSCVAADWSNADPSVAATQVWFEDAAHNVLTASNCGPFTVAPSGSGGLNATCAAALPDGAISFHARWSDAAGNSTEATASSIKDTAAPPAPAITAPAASSEQHALVHVTGTAEANAAVVVFEGTTPLGTATADPSGDWTLGTTMADGSHTIHAVATDAAGNASVPSADRTFIVDTVAPAAPVITAPANGTLSATHAVTVAGTAEANASVELFDDATSLATIAADGAGHWSFAGTFADGAHTVTATATDAAANTSAASAPVSFTVDTTAPAAPVISAPTESAVVTTPTTTIAGTAEANASVEVFDGATSLGTTSTSPSGAWMLAATLADGPHTLTAKATDAAANVGAASVPRAFSVDATTAVTVDSVTDPVNDLNETNTAASGTMEPGAAVAVTVTDGTHTTSPVAAVTSGGTWTLEHIDVTGLDNGTISFTATATDAHGNTATATKTAQKSTAANPPGVTIDSKDHFGYVTEAQDPAHLRITVTGTGPGTQDVTVALHDETAALPIAAGTVSLAHGATHTFTVDASGLHDGTITATASAADASSSDTAVLDRSAPVSTIDPTASPVLLSAPILNQVTFTGKANDATSPIVTVVVKLDPGDGSSGYQMYATRSGADPRHVSWEATFAPVIPPGGYTVKVFSVDDSGQAGPTVTQDVTIL